MQDLIKLIWDFRGPDSEITAQHHEKHLREFVAARNLSPGITGTEIINDTYSLASIVVTPPRIRLASAGVSMNASSASDGRT